MTRDIFEQGVVLRAKFSLTLILDTCKYVLVLSQCTSFQTFSMGAHIIIQLITKFVILRQLYQRIKTDVLNICTKLRLNKCQTLRKLWTSDLNFEYVRSVFLI